MMRGHDAGLDHPDEKIAPRGQGASNSLALRKARDQSAVQPFAPDSAPIGCICNGCTLHCTLHPSPPPVLRGRVREGVHAGPMKRGPRATLRNVSTRGLSPPRSPKTGHEPLDSSGSNHPIAFTARCRSANGQTGPVLPRQAAQPVGCLSRSLRNRLYLPCAQRTSRRFSR